MTLKELIQRAVDMAISALPGFDRSALDISVEPLLPVVFGAVGKELAASSSTRHLLRRTKNLAVANGSVTLDGDVLTEYVCEAVLLDPADTTKRYSLASWVDLANGVLDSRLGHFLIDRDVLTLVEPNAQYAPNSGASISLRLTIPCAPEVPALNSTVDVPDEILDLLIDRLAAALRPIATKR